MRNIILLYILILLPKIVSSQINFCSYKGKDYCQKIDSLRKSYIQNESAENCRITINTELTNLKDNFLNRPLDENNLKDTKEEIERVIKKDCLINREGLKVVLDDILDIITVDYSILEQKKRHQRYK